MKRKKALKNIIIATSLASTLVFAGIPNKSISFADIAKLVNATSLNVRSGAGTNYKKIGSLTKGTKVSVISESKGWSKISYNNSTGYVSSKYLSKVSTNVTPVNMTKEVNTNKLNVRSGAGSNYKKIGSLTKGTRVNVISESKGWSKIKYNGKNGYVSSKYLKKVSQNSSSVILNVPYISQYPDLPLGCEATSLTELLRYKGISVTKNKIAKEIPKSPNKNPNLGFVGSQYTRQEGIFQTIYPKALEKTAKKYRPNSADITGASVEDLEKELIKGNPSVVWITANCKDAKMGYWYKGTSDQIWVAKNLHVSTLTGFDKNYYYLTDPALGKYKISKSQFKHVYNTVGKKALVVR